MIAEFIAWVALLAFVGGWWRDKGTAPYFTELTDEPAPTVDLSDTLLERKTAWRIDPLMRARLTNRKELQ